MRVQKSFARDSWLVLRAVARAGLDAVRAFAIAPLRHAHAVFDRKARGGWAVRTQRKFTPREVLRLKSQFAKLVFRRSLAVGLARQVVIPHNPTEGLLTNFLHVLEVLHRVGPCAAVHVDWTLRGNELGFKYGAIGEDVWGNLFRRLGEGSPGIAHRAEESIDLALWGTGKDYLTGSGLRNHRQAYHKTITDWIDVTNPAVLERVRRIREDRFGGRFCIGVHRRVANAMVVNLQRDGKSPSLEKLIGRCHTLLRNAHGEGIIFLATDDAEAVAAFKSAFGSRLVVQDKIQRTTPHESEVHFGEKLSLRDAEDALVDTLLLSHCHVLLHGSSAISTAASILSPTLELERVFSDDD